jgi:hypothetical protein
VNKILQQVDSDNSNVELLLNKDGVKQKFLCTYVVERKYQPGTGKSHLASLSNYYDYLLLSASCKLSKDKKPQLNAMQQTVKRRMALYRNDANRRNLKKLDNDLQNIITPDAVKLQGSTASACNRVRTIPVLGIEYRPIFMVSVGIGIGRYLTRYHHDTMSVLQSA